MKMQKNLLIAAEKPFKVFSSSLNLDFLPNDKAKIRTELRYLYPTEDLIGLEKKHFYRLPLLVLNFKKGVK